MAQIELHPDFKDFLRLLNSHGVKYLVVGGYAVGYYGYPRATGDMDIWIAVSEVNAEKTAQALRDFGMPEKVRCAFFYPPAHEGKVSKSVDECGVSFV